MIWRIERWIAYPVVLWLTLFGGYLIVQGAEGRGAHRSRTNDNTVATARAHRRPPSARGSLGQTL